MWGGSPEKKANLTKGPQPASEATQIGKTCKPINVYNIHVLLGGQREGMPLELALVADTTRSGVFELATKSISSTDKSIQSNSAEMIFCTQCGKETDENAKFCSSCGQSLKAGITSKDVSSPGRAVRQTRNGAPREQQRGSKAGADAYNSQIAENALGRLKSVVSGVIGVVLALATYSIHQRNNDFIFGGLALCTFGAFVATIWYYTSERLSHDQYQALPGAVTDHGHQCVFCGWRGIYRHTPYKSDTTLADCSQCKAELWYE